LIAFEDSTTLSTGDYDGPHRIGKAFSTGSHGTCRVCQALDGGGKIHPKYSDTGVITSKIYQNMRFNHQKWWFSLSNHVKNGEYRAEHEEICGEANCLVLFVLTCSYWGYPPVNKHSY